MSEERDLIELHRKQLAALGKKVDDYRLRLHQAEDERDRARREVAEFTRRIGANETAALLLKAVEVQATETAKVAGERDALRAKLDAVCARLRSLRNCAQLNGADAQASVLDLLLKEGL